MTRQRVTYSVSGPQNYFSELIHQKLQLHFPSCSYRACFGILGRGLIFSSFLLSNKLSRYMAITLKRLRFIAFTETK